MSTSPRDRAVQLVAKVRAMSHHAAAVSMPTEAPIAAANEGDGLHSNPPSSFLGAPHDPSPSAPAIVGAATLRPAPEDPAPVGNGEVPHHQAARLAALRLARRQRALHNSSAGSNDAQQSEAGPPAFVPASNTGPSSSVDAVDLTPAHAYNEDAALPAHSPNLNAQRNGDGGYPPPCHLHIDSHNGGDFSDTASSSNPSSARAPRSRRELAVARRLTLQQQQQDRRNVPPLEGQQLMDAAGELQPGLVYNALAHEVHAALLLAGAGGGGGGGGAGDSRDSSPPPGGAAAQRREGACPSPRPGPRRQLALQRVLLHHRFRPSEDDGWPQRRRGGDDGEGLGASAAGRTATTSPPPTPPAGDVVIPPDRSGHGGGGGDAEEVFLSSSPLPPPPPLTTAEAHAATIIAHYQNEARARACEVAMGSVQLAEQELRRETILEAFAALAGVHAAASVAEASEQRHVHEARLRSELEEGEKLHSRACAEAAAKSAATSEAAIDAAKAETETMRRALEAARTEGAAALAAADEEVAAKLAEMQRLQTELAATEIALDDAAETAQRATDAAEAAQREAAAKLSEFAQTAAQDARARSDDEGAQRRARAAQSRDRLEALRRLVDAIPSAPPVPLGLLWAGALLPQQPGTDGGRNEEEAAAAGPSTPPPTDLPGVAERAGPSAPPLSSLGPESTPPRKPAAMESTSFATAAGSTPRLFAEKTPLRAASLPLAMDSPSRWRATEAVDADAFAELIAAIDAKVAAYATGMEASLVALGGDVATAEGKCTTLSAETRQVAVAVQDSARQAALLREALRRLAARVVRNRFLLTRWLTHRRHERGRRQLQGGPPALTNTPCVEEAPAELPPRITEATRQQPPTAILADVRFMDGSAQTDGSAHLPSPAPAIPFLAPAISFGLPAAVATDVRASALAAEGTPTAGPVAALRPPPLSPKLPSRREGTSPAADEAEDEDFFVVVHQSSPTKLQRGIPIEVNAIAAPVQVVSSQPSLSFEEPIKGTKPPLTPPPGVPFPTTTAATPPAVVEPAAVVGEIPSPEPSVRHDTQGHGASPPTTSLVAAAVQTERLSAKDVLWQSEVAALKVLLAEREVLHRTQQVQRSRLQVYHLLESSWCSQNPLHVTAAAGTLEGGGRCIELLQLTLDAAFCGWRKWTARRRKSLRLHAADDDCTTAAEKGARVLLEEEKGRCAALEGHAASLEAALHEAKEQNAALVFHAERWFEELRRLQLPAPQEPKVQLSEGATKPSPAKLLLVVAANPTSNSAAAARSGSTLPAEHFAVGMEVASQPRHPPQPLGDALGDPLAAAYVRSLPTMKEEERGPAAAGGRPAVFSLPGPTDSSAGRDRSISSAGERSDEGPMATATPLQDLSSPPYEDELLQRSL